MPKSVLWGRVGLSLGRLVCVVVSNSRIEPIWLLTQAVLRVTHWGWFPVVGWYRPHPLRFRKIISGGRALAALYDNANLGVLVLCLTGFFGDERPKAGQVACVPGRHTLVSFGVYSI